MSEDTNSGQHYDIAVVGSGSAAFATAISASRKDASVVLIEQGVVGGTCVNVGCVPSKALLAAAEARHIALDQRFPGVATSAEAVDMAALIGGKDAIVGALRQEKYQDLASLYGFEILHGHAKFVEGTRVEVNGKIVEADHYVVATGASPWAPPIPGLAEAGYLTSTTAMELDHVPASMIVIGANAVGLEQGQLFAHLGTSVTFVETLASIAPFEEPEVSEALAGILKSEGVSIYAGANIQKVSGTQGDVTVHLEDASGSREINAEVLLVATGRRPNTEGLGLQSVGVEVGPRGEVIVDDELRTANPRVWAAGDVTGHPQFVYVAGFHGGVIVANALGGEHRKVDYTTLPRITFTSPAIASVGLTDEQANKAGIDCECRVLSLENVPRAIVNRDTRGVAKIVAEKGSGRILGIHLLAEGAADSILAGVYALEAGFTVEKITATWAPYLTMSEAIKLTAQSFTRDVAGLSCCAS